MMIMLEINLNMLDFLSNNKIKKLRIKEHVS